MQSASKTSAVNPRLLIILNRFVVGGHIFDTIPLAYYLQSNFDILILYGSKGSDEIEALYLLERYPGLKIREIPSLKRRINPITDFFAYFHISREIKSFRPDIIHSHGAKPGLLGRLAGYLNKVPVIVHTFHGHFFHSYYGGFLSNIVILIERGLAKISTKIIATSQQQWNDLVLRYKIARQDKIQIIHLGIEENFFPIDQQLNSDLFRSKYNAQTAVTIGIIARITKVKNFALFTDIVDNVLRSTTTPVKFFIIGDGELKREVQDSLDKKKIKWSDDTDNDGNWSVFFTSWIADVSTAIPGLDVVILTSNNEGTGLSLVEAQLMGKPVVATRVGGVEDTILDGETGFFSKPNDALGFAKKLQILIDDPTLRRQMGIKASAFARKKFSKQTEVESFKALYFDLIKQTKGR